MATLILGCIAALVFFLALIGVALGSVNMQLLGFVFLSLAVALVYVPWGPWSRRRHGP